MSMFCRLFTAATLLWLTLLPLVAAPSPPGAAVSLTTIPTSSTKLRVHFIDVGAGDAILIETPTPNERHMFIDGGKGKITELRKYLTRFVGQNQIDAAMVTHPDLDHIKGMVDVFKKYVVREYWYTGYDSQQLDDADTWKELKKLVRDEPGIDVFIPISDFFTPGETVTLDDNGTATASDDVIVQFVNVDGKPPKKDPDSKRRFSESQQRNNASMVIKVKYKKISFLLTGDINGRHKDHIGPATDEECDSVEKVLVNLDGAASAPTAGFLKSTVLKAPHHGSNGSSSLPFLRKVAPEWVVFSAGHEFDHPTVDALRRYGVAGVPANRLLRTDEGDSTPEIDSVKDKSGDDSFIFETDGDTITSIVRVKL